MATRLRIVLVTCLLVFILMDANLVLAKKDGNFKKLELRVKTLEDNEDECKPCSLIDQLTERLKEMGEEIEQLKNPRTTQPPTPTITEAQVRLVDIHLRSEGCDDPGKTPNTCGIAYIEVDGKDYSLHGRGHNVVIVDAKTGAVLEAKAFDTFGDRNAGNSLGSYLDSKNGHQIVLVAVQDEASTYQAPAIDALKIKGATDPVVDFRGSFALVGYAQANITRPLWIAQQRRNSGQGPSEISLKIPLTSSA